MNSLARTTVVGDLTLWQPCTADGWRRMQAKRAYEIVLGKMLQPTIQNSDDEEVPYLKALHVQWGRILLNDLPTMWASPWEIKQLELITNDLLVCEGGEVGRAAHLDTHAPEKCIFQNALHRVRGSKIGDVGFLGYCLQHAAGKGWFDVLCSRATIAHFTVEKFRDLWLHLPSLNYQRRIADYLDAETAQIDALVAEKERMLALLEEKRAALISRTVTRGLDPDVPMKPSGLEWLGDIPAHWEVMQLKRAWASSEYGISENIRGDGDIKVLRMTCIADGKIDLNNAGEIEEVSLDLLLRRGDILFNRTNSLDQVAKVGLLDRDPENPTSFASYLVRIRVNERASESYLVYLLNSSEFLNFARKNAIPAIGQANLNPTRYGEIRIPLPPKEEQDVIVDTLVREHARTAELQETLHRSISLLKERRSALITAAVTGQLQIPDNQSSQ